MGWSSSRPFVITDWLRPRTHGHSRTGGGGSGRHCRRSGNLIRIDKVIIGLGVGKKIESEKIKEYYNNNKKDEEDC